MTSKLPPIQDLAHLARLSLTAEEAGRLQGQLAGILEHFEALQAVDVKGLEANPYAVDLRHVTRADAPVEGLQELPSGRANLDANAPRRSGDSFEVLKILEG